jgi:hypothetical protein
MDHKYKSLLQNIPTRHMIVKADPKDGKAQLKRLRERDIFNYFILGRISTIKNVLDSAEENGFFERQFAWHAITSVSITLCVVSILQIKRSCLRKSTRNKSDERNYVRLCSGCNFHSIFIHFNSKSILYE